MEMLLVNKQGRKKSQASQGVPVLFLGSQFSSWLGLFTLASSLNDLCPVDTCPEPGAMDCPLN